MSVLGTNVGFGDPPTGDMARKARFHGVREFRFDVLQSGKEGPDDLMPMSVVEESLRVCAGEGLSAVCLVSGKLKVHRMTAEKCVRRIQEIDNFVAQTFDASFGLAHEAGSEGNDPGWPYEPRAMVEMINACVEATDRQVCALLSNNTGRNGLAYTRACFAAGLKADALGIHPYRTTVPPEAPCPDGWKTREEEWDELNRIASVPLWATEVGWHSRPSYRGRGWLKRKIAHYSEDDKAAFFRREMSILEAHGVSRVHWFQWANGPDSDSHHEAGYGMFNASGEPLPLAWAMKEWADAH